MQQGMDWTGISLVIAALGSFIASMSTAVIGLVTLFVTIKNKQKIEEVATLTDGLKTELVNEVRKAAKAEGAQEEGAKREEKAEKLADRLMKENDVVPPLIIKT